MSAAKQRIPRNMARIEFLACREEIETLLGQGFDKRKIHTKLTESGRITMSYDALCKVLLKAARNTLKIQSIAVPAAPVIPAVPSAAKPTSAPSRRISPSSFNQCPDPRDMNPEDAL